MKEREFTSEGCFADTLAQDETLFHCANGYLGVRGCLEEGAPEGAASVRGAYINGFCCEEPICYGERLYGFPLSKQVIVNLPDAQSVALRANGEEIAAWKTAAGRMTRRLDLLAGTAERSYTYQSGSGALRITVTRMASFVQKELFLLRFCVESVDFSGGIELESTLDGDVRNFSDPDDPRVASAQEPKLEIVRQAIDGTCFAMEAKTISGGAGMACAAAHAFTGGTVGASAAGNCLRARFASALKPGETAVLTKYCAYTDEQCADPLEKALSVASDAMRRGFAYWQNGQKDYLLPFWERSRVIIQGDESTQAYLDLCQYELLCAAGQNGRSSVAAKGLSGEGYEGHYFWDCETYAFPFFLATAPEMARRLLDYRYLHLPAAREHARMLGHERGALYPWRTITGSECSSYYPSGSAQYHINADVAHAFCQYWCATRDEGYLPVVCEVLAETARLFLDAGHMLNGAFRIDGVTGPDEYTCIVDNNYYTNAGAAETLLNAAALCEELRRTGGYDALCEKIGLTNEELALFFDTGKAMYLPMDEQLGICKQDDSFLDKKRWDLSGIPPQNFPLLMHYHPLYINRHQVCKQADTVLAHFLYREETPLIMRRTFAYYERVTTHDSSLSACVFSLMAARLGDCALAMRYFRQTVGIDTRDESGNTRDGLHIANMGGAYLSVLAGFGGMRLDAAGMRLFPLLPEGWAGYSFPVRFRGAQIRVQVDGDGCSLCVTDGDEANVTVYDSALLVTRAAVHVRRPVRGVIFDLDGVVTDTAKFHFAAWRRIARELEIPFDERFNERFKGVSRAECLDLLLKAGGRELAAEQKAELLTRKNLYYLESLSALTERDVLPGVVEALALLKRRGIPCALFSVSKNTDFILERIGLRDEFDAVVSGKDIVHSKPHFEGYLLAAERMGVDPRLCLMVEDAEAGLAGARALSMRTLGIGANLPTGAANVRLADTAHMADALKAEIC